MGIDRLNRRIFGKKYLIPIFIAIGIAVSWVGVLDEYSDNYTDDSIIQAGVSYAIARGINGIISVLQTSTIQAETSFFGNGVSGSITPGEILDPINDLIERFSDVMSWALGSLLLQKILLGISAHGVFNLFITAFGVIIIAASLFKYNVVMPLASRIFVLLVFLRFSIVIVVLLNNIVDNVFISKQITSGAEELSQLRAEVVQLQINSDNSKFDVHAYEGIIRDDRMKIDEINKTILPALKQSLADTKKLLLKDEADLEEIQNQRSWLDILNPFTVNQKEEATKRMITIHEQQIETLEGNIEEHNSLVEQLREEIEVSQKRLDGEPVGIREQIKYWTPSFRSLSPNVIGVNITKAADNVIRLSVLFFLKAILVPLFFLFVLIKGVNNIWNADFMSIISTDE